MRTSFFSHQSSDRFVTEQRPVEAEDLVLSFYRAAALIRLANKCDTELQENHCELVTSEVCEALELQFGRRIDRLNEVILNREDSLQAYERRVKKMPTNNPESSEVIAMLKQHNEKSCETLTELFSRRTSEDVAASINNLLLQHQTLCYIVRMASRMQKK